MNNKKNCTHLFLLFLGNCANKSDFSNVNKKKVRTFLPTKKHLFIYFIYKKTVWGFAYVSCYYVKHFNR